MVTISIMPQITNKNHSRSTMRLTFSNQRLICTQKIDMYPSCNAAAIFIILRYSIDYSYFKPV